MMDFDATSYDPIPSGADLSQLTGLRGRGVYSFRDTMHLEFQVEYIDIQKYKDFAIQKCADLLDAVLAETFPKCEYCSNRSGCHGSSDCLWHRKTDVIQVRNLCRAIAVQNEARGGQCDESESG